MTSAGPGRVPIPGRQLVVRKPRGLPNRIRGSAPLRGIRAPSRRLRLYTLATAFTEFAFVLGNMGIGATLIQRQETDKKKIDNLFTATIILGLVLALSALLLAYPGARYQDPALIPLTQFTSLIHIFNALSIVPCNFLNRDMRFRERGIIDIATFSSPSSSRSPWPSGTPVWALLAMPAVPFFIRMVLFLPLLRVPPQPLLRLRPDVQKATWSSGRRSPWIGSFPCS